MANSSVSVGPGDRISIRVDDQHISRLTHLETRDLILQLLVFGGRELRNEVHGWLNEGVVQQIGDYIAPEADTSKSKTEVANGK